MGSNNIKKMGVGVVAALAITTSACGSGGDAGAKDADAKPLICVDFPRSDTDFWNAFISYVPKFADEMSLNIKTTGSRTA